MSTSKLIHSLPDVYRKDTDGNNFKILSLHGDAVDELRADISAVLAAQDIHQATAKDEAVPREWELEQCQFGHLKLNTPTIAGVCPRG